ncbi:uncharacterized protein LOC131535520 [Onychostoma macrolepis]|uniref:uncharacterized protein LOC131535520 n=1 Tax=Onychostoma macrolepis TaxID=369639 RepID=UPI002729DB38|nr:uncharacterized protein LOC131535520 [Onychostoma macrolepis]
MKKMLTFLVGYLFLVHGVSGDDTDEVSVMEGDSVILHTDVDTNKKDRMTWYFNKIRIAQINGDQNKICTDVQCPQRFRDKLNLTDRSLMITNINTTDAGLYKVEITSRNIAKTFSVKVHGVSAAERDEMKRKSVKEGKSVTLDAGVIKTNDVITWYFNDTRIAEIKTINSCTDVQCKDRFRDRLQLDRQTGSLTITDTRTTDSGLYKLQINSSRICTIKTFSVAVIKSGQIQSSAAVERKRHGAVAVVLLFVATAVCMIYYHKHQKL